MSIPSTYSSATICDALAARSSFERGSPCRSSCGSRCGASPRSPRRSSTGWRRWRAGARPAACTDFLPATSGLRHTRTPTSIWRASRFPASADGLRTPTPRGMRAGPRRRQVQRRRRVAPDALGGLLLGDDSRRLPVGGRAIETRCWLTLDRAAGSRREAQAARTSGVEPTGDPKCSAKRQFHRACRRRFPCAESSPPTYSRSTAPSSQASLTPTNPSSSSTRS